MSFVTISSTRFAVDAPLSNDLFTDIVGDLNFLNGVNSSAVDAIGVPLVINGSFEGDGVAGVVNAQNWTFTAGTGGTGQTSTAQQNHGAYSYVITQDTTTGHTGGILKSNLFMNVSPNDSYQLKFMLLSTRSDVQNNVVIDWYDKNQSSLSSTTVYSQTTAPTAWSVILTAPFSPPANAYFAKIEIQGGQNTTTPPGANASIYFDGFSIAPRAHFYTFTSFTTSGTFTVPNGVYLVRVRIYGKRASSVASTGGYGGYCEDTEIVKPGDTITATISSAAGGSSTVTFTGNVNVPTATNANGSTDGTASNGGVLVTGGSTSSVAQIVVNY